MLSNCCKGDVRSWPKLLGSLLYSTTVLHDIAYLCCSFQALTDFSNDTLLTITKIVNCSTPIAKLPITTLLAKITCISTMIKLETYTVHYNSCLYVQSRPSFRIWLTKYSCIGEVEGGNSINISACAYIGICWYRTITSSRQDISPTPLLETQDMVKTTHQTDHLESSKVLFHN